MEEVAGEPGALGRRSCDRDGEVVQRARWLPGRGNGVSKDLEAKVCALENSEEPYLAGRFRRMARRSSADNIAKRKTFPHLLSRC